MQEERDVHDVLPVAAGLREQRAGARQHVGVLLAQRRQRLAGHAGEEHHRPQVRCRMNGCTGVCSDTFRVAPGGAAMAKRSSPTSAADEK